MTPDFSLSPSLRRGAGPAHEVKFVLPPDLAQMAEDWAREHLTPDPNGANGEYRTLSIYCDTPSFDVFHRSQGFRRVKYRIRRYEQGSFLHLERKIRRGERVKKKRSAVSLDVLGLIESSEVEPSWEWAWFPRQVRFRNLAPAARLEYSRVAFHGESPEGPMRLTIDRGLRGELFREWSCEPLKEGRELLPGQAVLELKYGAVIPALFRELLAILPAVPGGASKYRLCLSAWGVPGGLP
jgi:hypothetical protein